MRISELTRKSPQAHYHADFHLVSWYPSGVFDEESAYRVVEFIELAEKVDGHPFNRFIDMTGFSRVQLTLSQVVHLARRRMRYKGPLVKSAFYAARLISLTIAQLYAELMEGSHVQVAIFRNRTIAANWLGVPQELLQPPEAKAK